MDELNTINGIGVNAGFKKSIYFLFSVIVFAYLLFRAIIMDMTYDEIWTLNQFVPSSFYHIINYTPCVANNHILNTVLIKILFLTGSQHYFLARLPNLLASIVFLFFTYRIANIFLSSVTGFVFFILLVTNPYLLDFFSLARGYGLALGFQMASLYYLISFIYNHQTKSAYYSLLVGSLAVLSNFAWLNYFIVLLPLILCAGWLLADIKYRIRFISVAGFISLALAAIVYEPLRKLKNSEELWYGGGSDFFSDSLISLAHYTLYLEVSYSATHWVLISFLTVTITITVLSFYFNREIISARTGLVLLLIFSTLSAITQHFLLGTLYPIDRSTLLYYPLFISVLCFSWEDISTHFRYHRLFLILALISTINFIKNASTFKCANWYHDSRTSEILEWLNNKGIQEHRQIKIDYSWPVSGSTEYLLNKNRFPFVKSVKNQIQRDSLNYETDFYIYFAEPILKVGYDANSQRINHVLKDTVLKFEKEKLYVFSNIRGSNPLSKILETKTRRRENF
ncbi:MAG: hypothetical protein IPP77_04180 [Bacteroidetes bacterium]|nr:hypothetical protein [Bacteroidota bacterium]